MSYNSNINSGKPPIIWSDFDQALQQINENFTLLGTVVARTAPISIVNVDTENPVKITTISPHSYTSGQRVTVTQTGISQLDNNTYYIQLESSDEINLFSDEDLTTPVDGSAFDAYSSGGGFVQGLSEFSSLDFENIYSNISPNQTETYDLGSSTKRWRDLWLAGSSIHLGDAVITSTGTTINLPVGSTIGGLRVDENYFKFISVAGQDSIEADDGTDTLTIAEGNGGITLTTDATTDTLTITNSGVTSLTGTAGQIGVSSSTGGITLTNLGVTSATAGQGISLNAGTGAVTITNSGVIGLDAGIGIQLSPKDPVTGVITITNSQPNVPQQVFSTIAVPPQPPIAADSTSDTLTIEISGNGLSIATDPTTDTLTFTNTGVTSLAVGNGLTINAGTGSINLTLDATLSRNIIGDVKGSVFGDDSSILVDAVNSYIYGNVSATTLRTAEDTIALGEEAGQTGQAQGAVAIGHYAGRTSQSDSAISIGWGAGEVSQGQASVAIGYNAGTETQGQGAVAIGADASNQNQGDYSIAIGNLAGGSAQGANSIAIGRNAGNGGTTANSIILNATGSVLTSAAAGFYVDPVRNVSGTSILQYNSTTGEISHTGEIYSDQQISITVSGEDSTQKTWYFGNDGNLAIPPAGEINNAIGDDPDVDNYITINGFTFQNDTSLDLRGIYDTLGYSENVQLQTVGAWVISAADDISMQAGTNLVGAGNNFTILAGNGDVDDPFVPGPGRAGGNLNMAAGDGGNGTTFGDGGDINLSAGTGGSGGGGDVNLKGGLGGGSVTINTGDASYTNVWTFSSDGGLKIPGDIKSENNINIDINLADSTLRRWSFGEDGIFNTAGSIKVPENSSVFFGDAGFIDSDGTSAIDIYANGTTDVFISTSDGGNSWIFRDDGYMRHPGELATNGDTTIVTDKDGTPQTWTFGEDGTLTLPGALYVGTIDTSDSSAITVVPAVTFNSDVTVENELFVGASRVMPIAELKSIVAASIDFADFQARIAAL